MPYGKVNVFMYDCPFASNPVCITITGRENPDEQLLNVMTAIGMNPHIAKGFVEMNASRVDGLLYEDYFHNKPVFSKVKLKDFAASFNGKKSKAINLFWARGRRDTVRIFLFSIFQFPKKIILRLLIKY